MAVDIASVSYVLASLSSMSDLIQRYSEYRARSVDPSQGELQDVINEVEKNEKELQETYEQSSDLSRAMAQNASDEIIDILKENVHNSKERIKRIYKNTGMPHDEKDRQLHAQSKDICWTIAHIYKLVGGPLDDDLEQLWLMLDCDIYGFI